MAPRRLLLLALLVLAYAPAAWPADEGSDDLLAPLTPAEGKKKKKKKAPPPPPLTEKKKEPPPLQVPVEPAAPARLAVRLPDAALKNAHLFVDDREIGVLPQEAVDVSPGEHRVTVKRLGFAPFNATVKVKESGVTELLAALEPLAAVVSLTSDVVGVEAFVDGKSYGPVPVGDVLVAPGSHQFRARKDGYEEQTQLMSVRAGQDYTVRFSLHPAVARADRPERAPKLEPKHTPGTESGSSALASSNLEKERDDGGPAWYGQWYVWAGAGAVAAGAAAGTIVLLQPKSPCGALKCDACINAPPNLKQFCLAAVHLPFMGVGGTLGK